MDPLTVAPNMEAVVRRFLGDQPEMIALVGDRVYTALPSGVEFPAVRVTQIDDEKITERPLWLVAFTMQIEAFGGTKGQASRIARTAEGLIASRMVGVHESITANDPDAVVTGVTPGSLRDMPDDTYEPAKPRFLFMSTIHAHPVATVTS